MERECAPAQRGVYIIGMKATNLSALTRLGCCAFGFVRDGVPFRRDGHPYQALGVADSWCDKGYARERFAIQVRVTVGDVFHMQGQGIEIDLCVCGEV